MNPWQSLRAQYPWPVEPPAVPLRLEGVNSGWFAGQNADVLKALLVGKTRVLEIGAWLGLSTRFLADLVPEVVTIDHWLGSAEHVQLAPDLLPILYETFIHNCFEYRHKICPVRASIENGIQIVADKGWYPEVIYLDASHEYKDVKRDLALIKEYFPKSILTGDDFCWPGVGQAVREYATENNFEISIVEPTSWTLK